MAKRLNLDQCAAVVVDVQEFFLADLPSSQRMRIESTLANFLLLLKYLRVPVTITLERPVPTKGLLPVKFQTILEGTGAQTLEKDFFDLTGEKEITAHLKSLNRKQIVLVGCETDVCILQSCLGLLKWGYEVYVIEDLLFSSSAQIDSAISRMKSEGAVFLTYKTLYHEWLQAVSGSPHRLEIERKFGPFPAELSDFVFA